MSEKIIVICGLSVLAIVFLPFFLVFAKHVGSFIVETLVGAVADFCEVWVDAWRCVFKVSATENYERTESDKNV